MSASNYSCKTCGGKNGEHRPSMFDKDGIGHPGHKMPHSHEVEKPSDDTEELYPSSKSKGPTLADIQKVVDDIEPYTTEDPPLYF